MSTISERPDDFPDRFSPMLVKELRQGLRAKTFVIVFLILQGLLGLILLVASAGATSARAGEKVSQIVFVFFSLAVLVVQPLRGIGALAGEIRGQTIDLMVLTRLSAMRIVLGKWVAIVSQSALITATIFPYLILRYYFGGMSLFPELLAVLMVLFVSAGFTAITVGISGSASVMVRGIIPIIAAIPLIMCIFEFGFGGELGELIGLFTFTDTGKTCALLLFIITTIHISWNMLSLGASAIAPHAENHATPRRLAALAVLVVAPVLMHAADIHSEEAIVIWLILAALPIAIALTENTPLVHAIAIRFARRGAVGRLAGRILYPGWPSGVMFTIAASGIGLLMMPVLSPGKDVDMWIGMLGGLGSLFLPGLLVIALGKKVKDRLAVYILGWSISFALVMILSAITDGMSSRGMLWGFVWCPLMLLPMSDHGISDHALFITGLIVDATYLGTLMIMAIAAQRGISEIERQALANE
ncbi:hypothetical protein KBB96_11390 [Luteolibacter ambystomatis]|uniref:ABC transporter permease n=1 Tax=Luteolibacter ambystomatis TaxID=2824561 RepID=A0A975G647_9BACT|nr:hypothetical protein [Luteolibacter ambystomatis]QUE49476.1 hypothetical protein KBB96_11390 [Luteolibacter ambystomatis]